MIDNDCKKCLMDLFMPRENRTSYFEDSLRYLWFRGGIFKEIVRLILEHYHL